MIARLTGLIALILGLCFPVVSPAQEISVVTVERPPFSTLQDGEQSGFSIDLWRAVATELGRPTSFTRVDSFSEMLRQVKDGDADIAVANISITAEREQYLDFSHAIFQSGLQIMVPKKDGGGSLWRALASRDVLIAVVVAFVLLFGAGMLMWWLERRSQPYFDRDFSEAIFPSFWWTLNLVVNGGFEERVPRTFLGRIFAVLLVISSLFIVSVFVAKITAVLTVEAIHGTVNSVNDLYGKRVATIAGSTAAAFLDARDFDYDGVDDLASLIEAFETGDADAVVFDAPVLGYYANNGGRDSAELVGSAFRRESYGFALPSGSDLLEPVNRALLKLREDGTYDKIYRKYFGARD